MSLYTSPEFINWKTSFGKTIPGDIATILHTAATVSIAPSLEPTSPGATAAVSALTRVTALTAACLVVGAVVESMVEANHSGCVIGAGEDGSGACGPFPPPR